MIVILLFIIGICFGSFCNVLIDRIPNKKSVLFGRSQCDFCNKQLAFYDLIPVVSYIFLRGRCRYCGKKLSLQYPLVEIMVGILFVLLYVLEMPRATDLLFPFGLDIVIVLLCFALVMMDVKYRILSDNLLIPLFLFIILRLGVINFSLIPLHLGIGFISALPLLLVFLFTKGRGMGFGDVKLIAILGFAIGFPAILIAYYFAFLTGAIAGVILILGRKKRFRGATIAFGPFLILGAGIAAVWGNTIWIYAKIFVGF